MTRSLGPTAPARRVVLLGASNLTMSIGRVWRSLRWLWNEPLDVLVAMGHGRSYGVHSKVFSRVLPGITECGLWDRLRISPPLPTAALVTDVGNDIVYGRSVEEIGQWVEACLVQLRQGGSLDRPLVLTELPLQAIRRLPPSRFRTLRSFFFPTSQVEYDEVLERAERLNERLHELAKTYGAVVLRTSPEWYQFDAIHFRWSCRGRAWQAYLSPWAGSPVALPRFGGSNLWWSFLASRPPQWKIFFGRERTAAQPSVRAQDGTTVSFF